MTENNLTTTARAVTKGAFGVKIADPENKDSLITRKPDENGVVDLSDLSTAPKTEPIKIGEQIGLINSGSLNSLISDRETTEQKFILNKVSSDGANLPTGIKIDYLTSNLIGYVNGYLTGLELSLSSLIGRSSEPISAGETGISDLSKNVFSNFTIEKSAIPNLIDKDVNFTFEPSVNTNFGSYRGVNMAEFDPVSLPISTIKLTIRIEIVNEKLILSSSFIGSSTKGDVRIPVSSITAY